MAIVDLIQQTMSEAEGQPHHEQLEMIWEVMDWLPYAERLNCFNMIVMKVSKRFSPDFH